MPAERFFSRETFNGNTRLDSFARSLACVAIAIMCGRLEGSLNITGLSLPLKHVNLIVNVSDLVMLEGCRQLLIYYGRLMQPRDQIGS